MDRRDYCVGLRGQEPIDLMGTGDRPGLGASITVERRPDARERHERSIVAQREQYHVLLFWSPGSAPAHIRQSC